MIKLKKVSKNFDSIKAVNNITCSIKKGEVVGFLGPNGAGKTTTLRMIAGVLPPSQGQIYINKKKIDKNRYQIKQLIGYLPESNPLYQDLTVEEFLKFFLELKQVPQKKWQQTIDFVVENTGIAKVFYRPINELSKGFKQRVGLSQAILTKPEFLILDEPTEGLDPNQRIQIQNLIKKLGKKRTVLIASHVLSEITKIANRIIIIHHGKIAADGTVDKLTQLKKGKIYKLEIKGKKIISELKKLKNVTQVKKDKKNHYTVTSNVKKDISSHIFDLAKKKKWTLLSMYKKKVELEDIFTKITTK